MTDPLDGTSWALIGPMDPGATAVTLEFADGSISGCSGCNRYRGTYRLVGDHGMEIGVVASTMMAGTEEAMQLERDVLRRFGEVDRWELGYAGRLALQHGEGGLLLHFAPHTDVDCMGTWIIASVHHADRQAVVSTRGEPSLRFTPRHVSGTTGCNSFSAECEFGHGTFGTGPLRLTRKYCEDERSGGAPTLMEQEQAIVSALEEATGFRLEGEVLTLLRPDGGVAIVLRRSSR